jgi:homocysteine S-methyltransferase
VTSDVRLPCLDRERMFIGDGGLETTMIFREGIELPCFASFFTVETDGRLPSGESIGEAIERVDAQTEAAAAYFMIHCAHPTHFEAVVADGGPWRQRVGGVRSNASCKSHAELDRAPSLDSGNPAELAQGYRRLKPGLPQVRVLGGCCGTDERHVDQICRVWLSPGVTL